MDPTVSLVGVTVLWKLIDGVSARYPGSRLKLISAVGMHRGLAGIVGFFGPLPTGG